MAVTRASKLLTLTDNASGTSFSVSLKNVIKVIPSASNSIIHYIDQAGSKTKRLVTEAASAIATASLSNDVAQLQLITLMDASTMYVNNSRVVFVDTNASGSATLRLDENERRNSYYEFSLPTAANFRTATDNLITVTILETGVVRYINNLYIDIASSITGGCEVLYNTNRTSEFHKININITLASLRTLVNAL